jgi:hypothetical protein
VSFCSLLLLRNQKQLENFPRASRSSPQGVFFVSGGFVNGTGAVCDQKILVFMLQMGKSKQSPWMG